MGATYKADSFNPPQVLVLSPKAATSVTGVKTITCGTASAVTDLGTTWIGRYATFDAEVSNIRVVFGWTSGITAVAGTASAVKGGSLLYAGQPQSWLITARSRYMATLAAASTTYMTIYCSSPE